MSAFQRYSQANAEFDFNEQRLRRMLAERLMLSKEQRQESLLASRESDSARGMLSSSSAVDNQTKKSVEYDRLDAQTQQSADDDIAGINRGRASAEADYLAAKALEEQALAKETPLVKEINPLDPLGWADIAAKEKAAGNPAYQDGYNPSDPNGWAAIAEQERLAGNPDYTGMANTALTPPSMRRTPARTPTRSISTPRPIPRNSIFRS